MLFAGLLLLGAAVPAAPQPGQAPPPPPAVKVGEPMPDFTLPYLETAPDTGRPQTKQVTLSSFRGRQPVVLAFFPAAFSPG
jgi:hypothetical protein